MGSEEDLDRAEVKARTLLLALMTSAGTPMISATTLKRKVGCQAREHNIRDTFWTCVELLFESAGGKCAAASP
jgi:hypothetical protein